LLTYYSREDHIYPDLNLPAKIAEYMATGNIIVTADWPAVRTLLDEGNSFLVPPDSVEALERTIRGIIQDVDQARRDKGLNAQRRISESTYDQNAKRVRDKINMLFANN